MPNFEAKEKCRLCDGTNFVEVLNLGDTPLANAFLANSDMFETEEKFPLELYFCHDCKSVQLRHTVSPDILFKNYLYVTGASKPLVEHFNNLAEEIVKEHTNSKEDLVVEVGSNDGSLLYKIKDKVRILGIDPAANVAKNAELSGVPTVVGFFDTKLSKEILAKYGPAKVVVANNVMAHIDNLKDVFMGVKNLLTNDGKFIFEVHWVGNLLNEGGFDQIYHEHIFYHSLHSLKSLLESIGMTVEDIKPIPIHGESMRVTANKSGQSNKTVQEFLEREKKMGLTDVETFKNFSKKVQKIKADLTALLTKLKSEGKKIIGYGAPAKGNTLLNYFNLGNGFIDYITDTTPAKQGMFTPGTYIKIVNPDILETESPDFILLLSWNYAKAILEKEKKLRDRGVKFIIPVPEVKVV